MFDFIDHFAKFFLLLILTLPFVLFIGGLLANARRRAEMDGLFARLEAQNKENQKPDSK